MKGRRPVPDKIRILAGKAPRGTPQPRVSVPRCPDHLDDLARVEWSRITKELAETGLMTKLDLAVVAGYAQLYSRWQQAEEQIAKDGTIIEGTGGGAVTHPAVSIARQSLELLRRYAAELGLSPSSRGRIPPAPSGKADRFEKFLNEAEAS